MAIWEVGILFFFTALCVLAYGLTITGFIIDKLGVKFSLFIGFILYAVTKFFLIFIDNKAQLYFIMLTVLPFSISLIFPTLLLSVKRLTF
jgi:predicted MFS family arabinose efflux permease